MIKSIFTFSLLSISVVGFSQNWFNQSNANVNNNDTQIMLGNRGSRGNTNIQRGNISPTNKPNSGNRGNSNPVGGLNQNLNASAVNYSNTILSNTVSSGNISRGATYINQQAIQQPSVVVQTRSRGNVNPTTVQNPIQQSAIAPINVSRGGRNVNDNVQVVTRQLVNEDNNFTNTRNINKEPLFEVNLVQKKEITALPKPSIDLALNLEVKKPEIKIEFNKNKSEKISVNSVKSSSNKKRKHAYYSQNSNSHFGLKVKTWIRKTFKTKRKIRVSVACPSF